MKMSHLGEMSTTHPSRPTIENPDPDRVSDGSTSETRWRRVWEDLEQVPPFPDLSVASEMEPAISPRSLSEKISKMAQQSSHDETVDVYATHWPVFRQSKSLREIHEMPTRRPDEISSHNIVVMQIFNRMISASSFGCQKPETMSGEKRYRVPIVTNEVGTTIDILVINGDSLTLVTVLEHTNRLNPTIAAQACEFARYQAEFVSSALGTRMVTWYVLGCEFYFLQQTSSFVIDSPLRPSSNFGRISTASRKDEKQLRIGNCSIIFRGSAEHEAEAVANDDPDNLDTEYGHEDPLQWELLIARIAESEVGQRALGLSLWTALRRMSRALHSLKDAPGSAPYVERGLAQAYDEFHPTGLLPVACMVIGHMAPSDIAPWDPRWFVHDESRDAGKELHFLRRAVCIAPQHKLHHLLCSWHRNKSIQRFLSSVKPEATKRVQSSIVHIASGFTPAHFVGGIQKLKECMREASWTDSARRKVLNYVRAHCTEDSITNWSFILREDTLDHTNNELESLFSTMKNVHDGQRKVSSVLPALKRFIEGPTFGGESFSSQRLKSFFSKLQLCFQHGRMTPQAAQVVAGVELLETLGREWIPERAWGYSYYVPGHTMESAESEDSSKYLVELTNGTCSCGLRPSDRSRLIYCKHFVALNLHLRNHGLVPLNQIKCIDAIALGYAEAKAKKCFTARFTANLGQSAETEEDDPMGRLLQQLLASHRAGKIQNVQGAMHLLTVIRENFLAE